MRLLIFAFLFSFTQETKELVVTEDISQSMMVLQGGRFEKFDGQPVETIHFGLNLEKRSGWVQIQGKNIFYVFINSDLVAFGKAFTLNIDSLYKIFQKNILVSLYQKNRVKNISVKLLELKPKNPFANPIRQSNAFNNFILLATLILIVFFTALLRTNPQLTLDYMNVGKIFSVRDHDESQITLRIVSSVNLLFYSFTGLLTSLALLIAKKFSDQGLSEFILPTSGSVGGYVLLWILLALAIVALLMAKWLIARVVAVLFACRDIAGFQFFHFVRVQLFMLFLIGGISIVCYSLSVSVNYYFFLKISCAILVLGAVLLYAKIMNKAQFSSFHLFSYLCATEFIPLIVLIKIFLK
ncbi:MAG: DUF4271 domain-containing protein [Bacteroidetes bacterium]|nr:DUF4271 domain-containing protein [Bacteroidota bacterium]